MKRVLISLFLASVMLIPSLNSNGQDSITKPAESQYPAWGLWGIGLKGSTDGLGVEVVKGFGTRLNIRLGYSYLKVPFTYPVTMELFSVDAQASLRFGGANLFLDFYPVKNVIHLTAGVMQNSMKHQVSIIPTSEYPYGDIMIPADELGSVEAILTPGLPFSPYLALGFGNTLSRQHRVSFNFEMGALYYGAPQLDLVGTKMLAPLASETNEQVIMQAIAQYKWYPMVTMQLTFRII